LFKSTRWICLTLLKFMISWIYACRFTYHSLVLRHAIFPVDNSTLLPCSQAQRGPHTRECSSLCSTVAQSDNYYKLSNPHWLWSLSRILLQHWAHSWLPELVFTVLLIIRQSSPSGEAHTAAARTIYAHPESIRNFEVRTMHCCVGTACRQLVAAARTASLVRACAARWQRLHSADVTAAHATKRTIHRLRDGEVVLHRRPPLLNMSKQPWASARLQVISTELLALLRF
jgi:hypothetical protein